MKIKRIEHIDAAKAKILGQSNVAVRTHAMDLSESRNADILAAECPDIDILINNAGAIPRARRHAAQ